VRTKRRMPAAEGRPDPKLPLQLLGGDIEVGGGVHQVVDLHATIMCPARRGRNHTLMPGTTEAAAQVHRVESSAPEYVVAEGEYVVVLARVTADLQSSDQADVLTFRGGKVSKF